jgi:molybdenum cofactor cytidylyltransferase
MILAIIPAAGKSARMGRPKLSLPLGDRSVLEHVIDALRRAGIEHILVVVGAHVSELAPVARAAGADVLLLSQETPDMRTTVELGLAWLEDRLDPQPQDSWFLVPAVHPALSASVVRGLIEARKSSPLPILIPTFQGRRGHPTLFPWKHVASIRNLPADEGINLLLREYSCEVVERPVDSPEVLLDLDTPADYEKLKEEWAARQLSFPSAK